MTTPDSPPLLVIISPAQSTFQSRDVLDWIEEIDEFGEYKSAAKPKVSAPSNYSFAETCYASNETCSSSTACSGRGACAYKGKKNGGDCWGCKCASGYAGVACQKEDYSIPFVIIILSSVGLVATLAGSVALLWSVGETKLPSTLNLAVGGPKRD